MMLVNKSGKGTIKRVHVNQHVIRARGDHPLRVKTSKENLDAREVVISHEGVEVARIVYRPDHPLSCGARVWIETRADVEVLP